MRYEGRMKRFFLSIFTLFPLFGIASLAPPSLVQAQSGVAISDTMDANADIVPDFNNSDEIDIGEDRNDRMTINVDIPHNDISRRNKGPYKFIIDTAAQRTIVSNELADNLEFDLEKELKITTLSGTVPIRTVYVPELTLGKQDTIGLIAPTFRRSALGADGILGLDSLQGQRILFDFKAEKISIAKQGEKLAKNTGRENTGREIIVRARRRDGQLIFTNATMAGFKVNVIIDTGSDSSIGNLALKRKLRLRDKNLSHINLLDVRGQKVPALYGVTHDLRIGQARFSSLPIAFADIAPFEVLKIKNKPSIFLGMDALRTFERIAINFENRRIYFLLRENVEKYSQSERKTITID